MVLEGNIRNLPMPPPSRGNMLGRSDATPVACSRSGSHSGIAWSPRSDGDRPTCGLGFLGFEHQLVMPPALAHDIRCRLHVVSVNDRPPMGQRGVVGRWLRAPWMGPAALPTPLRLIRPEPSCVSSSASLQGVRELGSLRPSTWKRLRPAGSVRRPQCIFTHPTPLNSLNELVRWQA